MEPPEKCEVCGLEAQGFHFGVASCRACSAFFRRSTKARFANARCLYSEECKSDENGYYFRCKVCRLRKCYKVGMDESKFQHGRDSIALPTSSNSEKSIIPKSFEIFVGRPEYVLFCTPGTSKKLSNPKKMVDLSHLVEKARKIMSSPKNQVISGENQLEKLSISFDFLGKIEKSLKNVKFATKEVVWSIWEFYLLTTAKFLSQIDEFSVLEEPIKMKILFATWHVFGRLEKLFATAVNRRRKILTKRTELSLMNGLYVEMDKQKMDVSWMSNYPAEQVVVFINGVRSWELVECIEPLEQLQPSNEEICFMFAQLCFEYTSKQFPGKVQEICDRFIDSLASDLHNYYVEELKMPKYSGRLAKLMKINNVVQKNIWENRPRIEVSKTFDIFNIEFSHPEMFIDTGF